MHGIHPESPAGLWWLRQRFADQGLRWLDPYQGKGGLGASSAQFVAAYLAGCHLDKIEPECKRLLDAYYLSAWRGVRT